MLEYFSLVVRVSVPHIKLTDTAKFVENLKSKKVVNLTSLKYSSFGYESCYEEVIILAKIETNMTK